MNYITVSREGAQDVREDAALRPVPDLLRVRARACVCVCVCGGGNFVF